MKSLLLAVVMLVALGAASTDSHAVLDTLTLTPNPAIVGGPRVHLRVTGTVGQAQLGPPQVIVERSDITVYLNRSCGFDGVCPPGVAVDLDIPLPLLLAGNYHVRVHEETFAVAAMETLPRFYRASLQVVEPDADPCVTGMWWHPSESGWGLGLDHQGSILFATWFTYDAANKAAWLVMPRLDRDGRRSYSGPIYRTTGPAFDAASWNSALVNTLQVGTARITFDDATNGHLTYVVDGKSGTKPITRQAFGISMSRCSF